MIKVAGKKADDNSRFFSVVRFSACLNLSRSIWGDGLSFSRRRVACCNVARVEREKNRLSSIRLSFHKHVDYTTNDVFAVR